MTTIAPAFPGTIGDHADQAPGWGTYTGKRRAGRVRKPNRRRGVIELAAQAAGVVSVAFTVGAVLASLMLTGSAL